MLPLWSSLMLLTVSTTFCLSTSHVNAEYGVRDADEEASRAEIIVQEQDELYEMLNTEKVLINTLRHFIESQEQKLDFLKSKTLEVRHIHDNAIDREKYLYNPINAVTILKRFTGDWKSLKAYAENFLNTNDFIKNFTLQTEKLTFPTEDDYDAALGNLLRIQDMYQLKPKSLSMGEVNGVKLGSEMTWSDCLEIGLKSSTNGYQTYAKYWMETALEKLPNMADDTNNNNNNNNNNYSNSNDNHIKTTTTTTATIASASASSAIKTTTSLDDYTVRARLEVMKALLNTEYKLGNLNEALRLANEILELQPKQKTVIKAKKQIEKELKRNNGKTAANGNKNNGAKNAKSKAGKKRGKKIIKTAEELMIEEICREASSLQSTKQIHSASITTSALRGPACMLVNNNLPSLLIQPFKVELLSLDPYVAVYHSVLTHNQMEDLKDFIEEQDDDTYEFTRIGQKKMQKINEKLLRDMTGHYDRELYDEWQVERYNFENFMDLEGTVSATYGKSQWQAQLLFNLQQPLMGGSVVFPQLELSVNLPEGSVLYWSLLNEFHANDYRSKYHLCPIISGTQITATANIKNI